MNVYLCQVSYARDRKSICEKGREVDLGGGGWLKIHALRAVAARVEHGVRARLARMVGAQLAVPPVLVLNV